jgi:hypothetical protein
MLSLHPNSSWTGGLDEFCPPPLLIVQQKQKEEGAVEELED